MFSFDTGIEGKLETAVAHADPRGLLEELERSASTSFSTGLKAVYGLTAGCDKRGLFFIYPGEDGKFYVSSSRDGSSWNSHELQSGWAAFKAPAVAKFNGAFYLLYQGRDGMYLASSTDGSTWNNASGSYPGCSFAGKMGGWFSLTGISLAQFGANLYVAYQGRDGFYVAQSSNGTDWTNPPHINWTARQTPSLASFHGALYVFYQGTDGLYLGSSTDGTTWKNVQGTVNGSPFTGRMNGWTATHGGGLAVDPVSNNLYLAYPGENGNLYVAWSSDGITWSDANSKAINLTASADVNLSIFNGALLLAVADQNKLINIAALNHSS